MDERGFRVGSGKAQLVVTMDPNEPLRMIDPENREYITSVECIGSAGGRSSIISSSLSDGPRPGMPSQSRKQRAARPQREV